MRFSNSTKKVESSKNWHIEVCCIETEIDGKKIGQLAYNLEETENSISETILTINNFSHDDYIVLEAVILGFYYIGNPLIGEMIYSNEYVALHKRTDMKKPVPYVYSHDCDGEGIVFLAYLTYPLVICNHRFQTSADRERKNISLGTVIDILIDMVDMIDAKTSFLLLKQLEKYWYEYPDSTHDIDSYYSLIKKLVRKMRYYDTSGEICKDFKINYPNLVVCEKPHGITAQNHKTQALAWRRRHMPESRLVQDSFSFLGYETIVELCRKAGGFNSTRQADNKESELLDLLKKAASKVLNGFILKYPDCLIIENDTAVCEGTANIIKFTNKKEIKNNNKGHKIRYDVIKIEIKKRLFTKEGFIGAFSTYCHELCHCFGGDASASFSRALTDIIELIVKFNEDFSRWLFNQCP